MAAFAEAAGVSVETVYKGFGTKTELVRQVLGAAVVGDDAPVALIDRPEMRAALDQTTGSAIIIAFADVSTQILLRVGPLLGTVLASSRAGEPELRAIARHAGLQRLADLRRVAESVAARGDLRDDLDVDRAADILWSVGSPEVYLELTTDRGWTPAEYRDWLADALTALLIR